MTDKFDKPATTHEVEKPSTKDAPKTKTETVTDPGPDPYAYIEDEEAREALREADENAPDHESEEVKKLREVEEALEPGEAQTHVSRAIQILTTTTNESLLTYGDPIPEPVELAEPK
jgi:hypothetical protein